MRVLALNTHDYFGGAEVILQTLRSGMKVRGIEMDLAVGERHGPIADSISLGREEGDNPWRNFCRLLMERGRPHVPPRWKANYKFWVSEFLAEPFRYSRRLWGHEDFEHPKSRRLLEFFPEKPDLIHAHNLHGDYFDLRTLVEFSRQTPVVVTLHDHWWMTGHCAHPIDCERWRIGCGACPDLDRFPAIARDGTAYNFFRKREIAQNSRIHAVAPSCWMLKRIQESPIGREFASAQVIANGVNLQRFSPGNSRESRDRLRLPEGKLVLLVAKNAEKNPFKDYALLESVLDTIAEKIGPWTLVIVGENRPPYQRGKVTILFREGGRDEMPDYYRSCDFLVHPARAETYPTVIMEAMACGRSVVATSVGGIPEQVVSQGASSSEKANGILVALGDAKDLTQAMQALMESPMLALRMGDQARAYAMAHFDEQQMISRYEVLYRELTKKK